MELDESIRTFVEESAEGNFGFIFLTKMCISFYKQKVKFTDKCSAQQFSFLTKQIRHIF